MLALAVLPLEAGAHRSGCHRWHSCLSDNGSYVCGDFGYCSQCPDNTYCLRGQVRLASTSPGSSPSATPTPADLSAAVVDIIDGDTIRVRLNGRVETVRYIGINTPEVHHPTKGEEFGGRAAMEANRRLVVGQTVRLEFDVQARDRYRRLLVYMYVSDLMVNAELVRLGYAQVMTVPPNVKYQNLFLKLQREAREARRGLWGELVPHESPPQVDREGHNGVSSAKDSSWNFFDWRILLSGIIAGLITAAVAWGLQGAREKRNAVRAATPEMRFGVGWFGGSTSGIRIKVLNESATRKAFRVRARVPAINWFSEELEELASPHWKDWDIPLADDHPLRRGSVPAGALKAYLHYHDRFGRRITLVHDLVLKPQADGFFCVEQADRKPKLISPRLRWWYLWWLKEHD